MKPKIELPKIIDRFIFDSITTSFTYKSNKMFSAEYRNPKNGVKLTIFTFYDIQLEKQTFGVKVKGSTIRGIHTVEEAVAIATEIIKENDSFLIDN